MRGGDGFRNERRRRRQRKQGKEVIPDFRGCLLRKFLLSERHSKTSREAMCWRGNGTVKHSCSFRRHLKGVSSGGHGRGGGRKETVQGGLVSSVFYFDQSVFAVWRSKEAAKKHVGVEVLVGAGVVGAGVAVGAAGGGLALGADQEPQVLAVRRQEGVHR